MSPPHKTYSILDRQGLSYKQKRGKKIYCFCMTDDQEVQTMKIALVIACIIAGLMMIVFLPWIIGGAAIVAFCFWNEWYVAGVIIGILALLCQIFIGSALWGDSSWDSESSNRYKDDGGFGLPEMFVAYKIGEHYSKKKDDK